MTAENDIVLIHYEDKPVVFARIEAIHPDVKPDWYQVKLLMLQVPVQPVTWILRSAYINGTEFTMGGATGFDWKKSYAPRTRPSMQKRITKPMTPIRTILPMLFP